MKRTVLPLLYWIQFLSLAVWVGMLCSVAVFAPVVFRELSPDRYRAGQVVGGSLRIMGRIELAAGALLLLALLLLAVVRPPAAIRGWRILLASKIIVPLLMLITTGILVFRVGPRMDELRVHTSQVDFAQWTGPGKEEFDRLHRLYSGAYKGVLFGGVVLFLIMGIESAAGPVQPETPPGKEPQEDS